MDTDNNSLDTHAEDVYNARLQSALRDQGTSELEAQQAGIASAQRLKDKGAVTAALEAGATGVGEATKDVGVDLALRLDAATQGFEEEDRGPLMKVEAFAAGMLKRNDYFDDPEWRPRSNPQQLKLIKDEIERLGLDIESSAAQNLISSGSQTMLFNQVEMIERHQQNMQNIADSGLAGQSLYLLGSMFDADIVLGAGIFKGLNQTKKLRKVNEAIAAGKITSKEGDALMKTSSRLDNIITGAEAGATSALLVEGTRSMVNPNVDGRDVAAALITSTAIGSGIGSVLRTKHINDVVEDLATVRTIEAQQRATVDTVFNKAHSFTAQAEGLIANVKGDRGGFTALGISSKFFPKQAAEAARILKEKGPRAAHKYQKEFMKKEFWDKVYTKDMTPEQAQVMYDTAIHSGVAKAKELFKKAKGDVGKFLDLREDFLKNLSTKDGQAKFANGWQNRIDNLRASVQIDPEKSVGAAGVEAPQVGTTKSSERIIGEAWEWLDNNPEIEAAFEGLTDFVDPNAGAAAQTLQKYAGKVYSGIQKTPFISDYDRVIRDAGVTGKHLAWKMLSSPVGQVVNNRNADAMGEWMHTRVASHYAPNAKRHYDDWARDNNISKMSPRYWRKGEAEYGRQLQEYREALHAGSPLPKVHESIVKASEDLDRAFAESLDNLKKQGVEGFEDVSFKAGYTPRKWMGSKFSKMEQLVGKDVLVQSLKKSIMRSSPDLEEPMAYAFATAIRRSALDSDFGSPAGFLGTVSNEGLGTLQRAIQDTGIHHGTGMTPEEMANAILYKGSERGTAKSSRRRIDLDLTQPIEGTDFKLLDLVSEDVYGLADRVTRAQSNHAALASQGIQLRDRQAYKQAAIDEARELGLDGKAAGKAVDDLFSYFSDGAFGGGQGPITGRLNKLAILSYLPQLGVTQTAEIGVAMGTSGIRAYKKFAGKSMHDMLKDADNDVLNSLWASNKFIGDHQAFVVTDHLDEIADESSMVGWRMVDKAMDKGLRGLGYVSGFYKVNEFLHRTSALTMNNYVVRAIKEGKNSKRLDSMGVDNEFRTLIKNKIKEGRIKFDDEGDVISMGAEGWAADELQLLQMVTRRNVDRVVQKTRKGEAQIWQYDPIGGLFSSLRSFVFNAAQKQLLSNARLADPEAFQMLLATTVTAGAAYSAKQILNGNIDRLEDPKNIAVGAIQWSSLLSPAMMAVDPLAYMLGADKIPGSPFPLNSWRYSQNGLLGLPPGVSALNDVLGLGRIPMDLLDDWDLDRNSINDLKSIPIIGRSYPMVPIIEALDQ